MQADRQVALPGDRTACLPGSRSTTTAAAATTTTSALLSRDTRIWLRGGRRQWRFAKQQPQPPHSSRRCRCCYRTKNKRSKPLMMAKPRSRSAGTAQAGRRRFRPISSFCHSLTARCCQIPSHRVRCFDLNLLIMRSALRYSLRVFFFIFKPRYHVHLERRTGGREGAFFSEGRIVWIEGCMERLGQNHCTPNRSSLKTLKFTPSPVL